MCNPECKVGDTTAVFNRSDLICRYMWATQASAASSCVIGFDILHSTMSLLSTLATKRRWPFWQTAGHLELCSKGCFLWRNVTVNTERDRYIWLLFWPFLTDVQHWELLYLQHTYSAVECHMWLHVSFTSSHSRKETCSVLSCSAQN